jgi:citronellol/citronellal dehydrogenase
MSLSGKVAIVTGGTRGIGRKCVLALAREGCNVVIAAKSVEDTPNLPGSIYSVAKEAEALGVGALPSQVDLRNEDTIHACVEETIKQFGRVDILVNNASALWWQDIV